MKCKKETHCSLEKPHTIYDNNITEIVDPLLPYTNYLSLLKKKTHTEIGHTCIVSDHSQVLHIFL